MKILLDPILQLVDILRPSDEQQVSTSLSGKHRIDFLFISCKIASAVERCGYNKFNQIKIKIIGDYILIFIPKNYLERVRTHFFNTKQDLSKVKTPPMSNST
jgi:hypothetical protein